MKNNKKQMVSLAVILSLIWHASIIYVLIIGVGSRSFLAPSITSSSRKPMVILLAEEKEEEAEKNLAAKKVEEEKKKDPVKKETTQDAKDEGQTHYTNYKSASRQSAMPSPQKAFAKPAPLPHYAPPPAGVAQPQKMGANSTGKAQEILPDDLIDPDLASLHLHQKGDFAIHRPQKREKKEAPAASSRSEKKLTFADIMQGFIKREESEAHESQGPMNSNMMRVKNNVHGTITGEQLRNELFYTKIFQTICHHYRIIAHEAPRIAMKNMTQFQLIINRDGSINSLIWIESSGVVEIDRFIERLFQYASSAFPPVPSYFEGKTYKFIPMQIHHLEDFRYADRWTITTG